VTSTSAVSSQSDAVRLTLKTGPEGLTAGIVALMVIAGFLFLLLMAAAISCLVRSALTVWFSTLNSSLLKHGSWVAKRDTVNNNK